MKETGSRGMTLLEVMLSIGILIVGSYFLIQVIYGVSAAQREIHGRLEATSEAEQIAEAVMAYTGDNAGLYNTFHDVSYDPPADLMKVTVQDSDTDVAKVTVQRAYRLYASAEPGQFEKVRQTIVAERAPTTLAGASTYSTTRSVIWRPAVFW